MLLSLVSFSHVSIGKSEKAVSGRVRFVMLWLMCLWVSLGFRDGFCVGLAVSADFISLRSVCMILQEDTRIVYTKFWLHMK